MSASSSISPLISNATKYCHFVMPLKMIKAVKKLKFWSRKKRKRNSYEPYYPPPPPPTCHHCCCSCSSTQPSAPPLPPWLEVEETHDAISAPSVQPLPEVAYPSQSQFTSQETVIENTTPIYPTLPSYQQYMVPDPVYGMPVVQTPRKERSAGFFGCVVNFGVHLIRCFCPCFRIREVY